MKYDDIQEGMRVYFVHTVYEDDSRHDELTSAVVLEKRGKSLVFNLRIKFDDGLLLLSDSNSVWPDKDTAVEDAVRIYRDSIIDNTPPEPIIPKSLPVIKQRRSQ